MNKTIIRDILRGIVLWVMVTIFIIIVSMFIGCGGGGDSQLEVLVKDTTFTPLGFQVAIPQSIYTHGLYFETHTITDRDAIKFTLLSWVDQRAREYIALRQVNLEDFVHYPIVLFDDFKFACSAVNAPTGWCAGLLDGGVIGSAIYQEWSGIENIPPYNYPPHTLAWSTRTLKWWAGIIPDSQIGMPSLIHEWDEVFGQAVN